MIRDGRVQRVIPHPRSEEEHTFAQQMIEEVYHQNKLPAAVPILEELGMPDRLRDAHMEYAELLEARQDMPASHHHWKRAAEIGRLASLGVKWAGTPAAKLMQSAGPSGAA